MRKKGYPCTGSPLAGLAVLREITSKRESSWDRTGRNKDCVSIAPKKKHTLAVLDGPGCVRHIWITVSCRKDELYLRKLLLRMFWDGEKRPSVEVPIGDFFGVGHGVARHFVSLPLNMIAKPGRGNQAGMNCYFPMPFNSSARIEVENQAGVEVEALYYYVDYEVYPEVRENTAYFHAQWRRENPCKKKVFPKKKGKAHADHSNEVNLDGKDNYVILDAKGRGHYVGCLLNVDNTEAFHQNYTWFGEGDDMIFVDGEAWPPSLHGTGTEDYFCSAWGFPCGEYAGPYHG
ncbi:MAG: glycoside hydrolase family 172 protein, partial [Planctomycetota bacterium]